MVEDSPPSEASEASEPPEALRASQPAGALVGSLFGPYRLIRLLGSGGFGEVYEAEDTTMHRAVALKLLGSTFSQDPVFRERLFREARTAGRLREPHVLPIHRCGEIDGQVYIDMRLVRGVDLETVLHRHGTLDPARAVAIVRQVAAALDAAHAETVIHRDVKPANILLAEGDFASLVDFGLANAAGDARLTQPGKAVGTFEYVAPERLTNAPVDHRCDVYALACVLYELLTGAPPYSQSGDLAELMTAQITAPIPLPSQQRTGIPVGFDEVIARGMAKNPDNRYRSAGDLATAAERALDIGHTGAWATPQAPVTRPWQHTPTATAPDPPFTPPFTTPPTPPLTPPVPLPRARTPRRRTVITLGVVGIVAVIAVAVAVAGTLHRSAPTPSAPARPRPSPTTPTVLPFPAMTEPRGVAVDDNGAVYVAELGPHVGDGKVLQLPRGQSTPVELPFGPAYAQSVAVDTAHNVYIADTDTPAVWKLTPGAHGPTLLPFEHLGFPVGVAVGRDGAVYVADQGLRQVIRLAPGDAAPTQLMPTTPLNTLHSLTVDNDGNVYIVDAGDRRILKLAPNASTPTDLPFVGVDNPFGVAVDKAGNIFVSDPHQHRLLKLTPGATSSTDLHLPELKEPSGLATDNNGDLYILDCQLVGERCVDGRVLALGGPA